MFSNTSWKWQKSKIHQSQLFFNMTQKKNFTASNPNFWARLLIFAFSILALIGIKFPSDPTDLATSITTTVSGPGFIAVIGILIVSVIMPIINFVRTKPKITAANVFGSANFWIYLGSFAFGILVLFGINIPEGTADQIVAAIYEKDWNALFTVATVNILDPFIRWLKDKKTAQLSA